MACWTPTPLSQPSGEGLFIDQIKKGQVIHVKGKLPAQEVMPEFIDAINHTEVLSLRVGVVLFSAVESRRLA